ncbi:MAG: MarR family transcriptional regulator [Zhengella sp.]|uniref:MarR family winged helix-turn-helix transcriptional regulator n=1 Tax=Zhengella sp. TaxID=2282762 RepID=UPI001E05280D|nr:MarR family transcriptional regulator [Notoacmeibacter sp.]MCC0028006.1 MarR family transcriptional regulator [Brucellaceae bacterium]
MENDGLQAPRSLGRALNFTAGAATAMCQAMLSRHDLTLAQWVVLSALWRRDGLSVGDLVRYTGNNAPAISRILDRMEQKDLVRREANAGDRRAIHVRLGPAAGKLTHLRDFWEEVNARLLDGFTAQETQLLFSLLERAEANARRHQDATHRQDGT